LEQCSKTFTRDEGQCPELLMRRDKSVNFRKGIDNALWTLTDSLQMTYTIIRYLFIKAFV